MMQRARQRSWVTRKANLVIKKLEGVWLRNANLSTNV